MGKRSEYDQDQAAGWLRVGRAAFRWAVASGVVPAPDAGPGVWSRAAVEAMDTEAIAAAMGGGPLHGGQATDRLATALGTPNPPGGPAVVSVAAVQEMVKARLLTNVSADPEQPLLHPAEVDVLAARRDAGRLLAEAAPLGPDQAASRLGVRRTEFESWKEPPARCAR